MYFSIKVANIHVHVHVFLEVGKPLDTDVV